MEILVISTAQFNKLIKHNSNWETPKKFTTVGFVTDGNYKP